MKKFSFIFQFKKYEITFLLFVLAITNAFAQLDTISYQWPLAPMTMQRNIGGTFGEYRSTSENGHFHNGTDVSAAGGTPVYAVLGGVVASAYDDGSTGYDSYVRITSNVNGQTKNLTYYHTRPIVSNGQQITKGQQISNIAIDHVHIIDYRANSSSLSGNQINAIRPGGGITIYSDPWKPHIRYVKFLLDGTNKFLSSNSLGSKVDIIVHVQEVNGTSSASTNNGTYKIGYKILSEDKKSVIYNPIDDGLRFEYYYLPYNNYVNINYYQPESNTSQHVYIVTNGTGASDVAASQVVQNNYWNVDDFPYGNYNVMVFTEDTRGNADTVFIPVTTTDIDLIPPTIPDLKYARKIAADSLKLAWIKPPELDLKGYRLYYSLDGENYNLRDKENVLTNLFDSYNYYFSQNKPLYLRLTAVDSADLINESEQSDVYGVRLLNDNEKILIVDGFDRYGGTGSWQKPSHDFIVEYGASFNLSFESCSNDEVINRDISLNDYELVIWILGDESTADETFSLTEQSLVAQYLENGGKLFVSGSEIAWDLEGASSANAGDTQFLRNYLKAKYITDDSNIYSVSGADSTIFSGLTFGYGITSQGSPYPEDYPDVIEAYGGSVPILKYNNVQTAGIAYTGSFDNSQNVGQLIYIAFPFETISLKESRTDVMTAALKYFGLLEPNDVIDKKELPSNFILDQNYPNPFNPTTKIKYSIPASLNLSNDGTLIQLKIYDILGNEIATLVNKQQTPGNYEVEFNASNLASGIYFYRLTAGSFVSTKKMVLMK